MKSQTRNIETYKVGTGARLNEFDFHKAQEEMQEHHGDEPGTGSRQSETKAERVARLTKTAHEKVMRRKKHRHG
jgi:hypothetical protein